MQINIDKKTGIFSGVIVLLVGVIIFMLGARDSSSGFFGMNHSSMMGQTGTSSNSSLLGSDAMFFQMMDHGVGDGMGDGMGGMLTNSELSTLKSLR